MRRLIVCADGTWNTPDQEDNGRPAPTNVVKLHACVSEKDADGVEQICYDHPGVGTEGGWFSRAAGGAYGKGLSRNIKSAYKWLADTYETGDEVFLFGFSRGAFTVRSLGGMISACGLLKTAELETPEAWTRVDTAFEEGYRNRETGWADGWERFEDGNAIPIRFVGVWDTVGALGVPNDLALLNILDDPEKWAFHDTKLGRNVVTARHALALDEMRASFTPTLWTEVPDDADGKFYVGEILQGLGSALGWLESGWKKASRNDEADFLGTKRVEDSDWFCLIGVVANGGNPGPDGTPEPHDTFEIGEGTNHVVTKGGYFHPFANDAWATYENNRGQVTLSISRIE